jgi:hypothetical protein
MTEQIDADKLAAILQAEYRVADGYHDQLNQLERLAFEYYEAQPFGNEVEGRSQMILPDVQESIDYMTQSVLRTFVSGDRAVEFEAMEEGDEYAAKEATEAVNYLFMRRQDGYRLLHDGILDGLLRKRGVFKTVKETVRKVSRQRLTIDPVQLGEMPEDVELDDVTENEDGSVTVSLKQSKVEQRFVDYCIPTSEFRFTPSARHEDHADYLCHVCEKTRSELVEMGFDADQVYRLPGSNTLPHNEVESGTLDQYLTDESSPALQKVQLCEEYARVDMDGDGIAERVKIYRVENEILIDAETGELAIETVDEQPFAVFCPYPRSHRMIGYSLADKVMDLQLARSFAIRQLFDGMAFTAIPRPIVDSRMADADTYSDILNPIPGSPIRVPGGAGSVQPYQSGFDVGKSLQVLEMLTGERESRTGITRLNQGLDADALNKTATGTALMQSQGQQQEEYVARNFAETLGRLFAKKYRLIRAEGEPFSVKVDGQYKQVDPSQWPEDMNLTIRVGLGSGSKDKRIQYRMMLLQPMAEGLAQGLVSPKNAFNLIDGLARDMGIGDGDEYWIDPDSPEAQAAPQEEKPDPEMLKVQAEQQKAQAQLELEQGKAQAQIELEREKAGASVETDRMKAQAQIEAMREKHGLEMQQARERMAQEAQIAREKMMLEAELEQQAMAMKAATDVKLGSNREGGSLDA